MKDIVNFRNLSVEDNEEESRNITILESKGQHTIFGPMIESLDVTKTMKIWQVNIGSEEQPKLENIGE